MVPLYQSVDCPLCGAGINQRCVTRWNTHTRPHEARRRAVGTLTAREALRARQQARRELIKELLAQYGETTDA